METNLTCDEVNSLLSAFIDNELSLAERESVKKHLKSCSDCNNKYLEFINIRNLLQVSSQNIAEKTNSPFLSKHILPNIENIECCRHVAENLPAFVDNELSEDESALVAEHLKECKACKRDLEELKEFKQVIKSHAERISSNYDHSKHLQASEIAEIVVQENRRKSLIYVVLAAVIVGLVAFVGVGFNGFEIIKSAIRHTKPPVIYVKAETYVLAMATRTEAKDIIGVIYED